MIVAAVEGNPKVFIVLGVVFVLVGIYLVVYNLRKRSMMKKFAMSRGLPYRLKDNGEMEKELCANFGIEGKGLVRQFYRVRDMVRDEGVVLTRTGELLDLVSYAEAQNKNFGRVAAYFDVDDGSDLYVLRTRDGEYMSMVPGLPPPTEQPGFDRVKAVIESMPPFHALNVTVKNGKALIYPEPLVVGGEKEEDLDYLLSLAKKMKKSLD